MDSKNWLQSLFDSIDNQDVDTFLTFLCEDVIFRFANAEPVKGKTAVRDVVRGFFSSIDALHHDVREVWDVGNALICYGMVTYTRHDSSTLTVPFANILKLADNLIDEYLIFSDASGLHGSA